MLFKKTATISLILTTMLLTLYAGACSREKQDLTLEDLSPSEYSYIERIIVLERAKAVALNDRELGNVILDSLMVAWGDSAESETAALAPKDPERSKAVHQLLVQITEAENDSLKLTPTVRRLTAPMSGYQPVVPDTSSTAPSEEE